MRQQARCRDLLLSWDAGAWGEPCSDGQGVSVLRSTNFRELGRLSFDNQALLDIDERTFEKKRLQAGDILLERSGGGPLQPVGRVVLFPEGKEGERFICGNFISRLVPDRSRVDPSFLTYTLIYWHASGKTEKFQTATTGIRNLQLKQYLDAELWLPDTLDEQRRIAARLKAQLAEVETARQAAQIQLREIKSLINAIVQDGMAASAGEPLVLGDVVRIDARIVDPKESTRSALPHISAENISSITGTLHDVQSAAEDGMESGKYLFNAGNVLYSKLRPYLRKATVVNFVGLCSADMYPLCFDESRVDPEYLRTVLVSDTFTAYANEMSARSRMPKLNREQLLAYKFELPSIDEQRRIVVLLKSQLAEADALRAALNTQQSELATLPQRLLAQAFEY